MKSLGGSGANATPGATRTDEDQALTRRVRDHDAGPDRASAHFGGCEQNHAERRSAANARFRLSDVEDAATRSGCRVCAWRGREGQ